MLLYSQNEFQELDFGDDINKEEETESKSSCNIL